jgi:hypothetical protein
MNDDCNRSESVKLIATAERPTVSITWEGECPQCGMSVELGYAGRLPVHEPPRTESQTDEWLGHVRVRTADIADHTEDLLPGFGPVMASAARWQPDSRRRRQEANWMDVHER